MRTSPTGEIWVGTGFGLGRYNKTSDDFKWYLPKDGLSGASIRSIEFDDNGMWVSTNNGLDFYDGVSFKKFSGVDGLDGNRVQVMHYSKPKRTLFLGTTSALYALKDDKFSPIHVPELANAAILSLQTYKDSLLVLVLAEEV